MTYKDGKMAHFLLKKKEISIDTINSLFCRSNPEETQKRGEEIMVRGLLTTLMDKN